MLTNFQPIRPLHWEEVFLFWYQNEGERDVWKNLAVERGFSSWADWRLSGYADRFQCSQADWYLYELNKAQEVIGQFYGGPFRNWLQKYYAGAPTRTFAELACSEDVVNNLTIQAMATNYPYDTVITALELTDERLVVIEGMHRCCALVLMAQRGQKISHKVIMAVGKSKLNNLSPVEQTNKKYE
jgi:hypothetical protein